jgi:hypothetical protein
LLKQAQRRQGAEGKSPELKGRIDALKAEAAAVGLAASPESECDLLDFVTKYRIENRPYVSLLDNGNFRALWTNPEGEQIGLQFRGDDQVQFVLFAKRLPRERMARSAGRDTVAGIDRQIAAHDLWRLARR